MSGVRPTVRPDDAEAVVPRVRLTDRIARRPDWEPWGIDQAGPRAWPRCDKDQRCQSRPRPSVRGSQAANVARIPTFYPPLTPGRRTARDPRTTPRRIIEGP